MDYLKTDAVLWKREERESEHSWLEASGEDRKRADQWGRQDD